jgi:hypothetical protein
MCHPTARPHREPRKAQARFAANSEAVLIRIQAQLETPKVFADPASGNGQDSVGVGAFCRFSA